MLLRDFNAFQPIQILAESKKSKTMRIRGVFSEADKKNGNGRIYPRALLEREIAKLRPLMEQRRLCGELDHPDEEIIHLANVSHLLTNMTMDSNGVVIGEAEILDTPSGRILQELCRGGVRIGISSRSTGSLEQDPKQDAYIVQENLRMITFDMVADPSCQNAFPQLVEQKRLQESKIASIKDHEEAERIFLASLRRLLR